MTSNLQTGTPLVHLLLKRAGNQPAELAQTVVDSVTAPFLNDLANDATCYNVITLRMHACVLARLIMGIYIDRNLLRDAFSSPAPELMWWETWTPEENSCSFKEITQAPFTLYTLYSHA